MAGAREHRLECRGRRGAIAMFWPAAAALAQGSLPLVEWAKAAAAGHRHALAPADRPEDLVPLHSRHALRPCARLVIIAVSDASSAGDGAPGSPGPRRRRPAGATAASGATAATTTARRATERMRVSSRGLKGTGPSSPARRGP